MARYAKVVVLGAVNKDDDPLDPAVQEQYQRRAARRHAAELKERDAAFRRAARGEPALPEKPIIPHQERQAPRKAGRPPAGWPEHCTGCEAEGVKRKAHAQGQCSMHLKRIRRAQGKSN